MSVGFGQILLIMIIILIVFGAGKLPKVMGDLGEGLKNFKKAIKEDEKNDQ